MFPFHSTIRERPFSFDNMSNHPNLLEVTGTSIPLLATVLGGFSVTIIVELVTQPDAQAWGKLNTALTLLAIAVPFFLATTIFATWGQSCNYHALKSELELNRIDVDKNNREEWDEWIRRLDAYYTVWASWYSAARYSFLIGMILFIAGTDILLWKYIGIFAGALFILLVIGMIVMIALGEKTAHEIMKSALQPQTPENLR